MCRGCAASSWSLFCSAGRVVSGSSGLWQICKGFTALVDIYYQSVLWRLKQKMLFVGGDLWMGEGVGVGGVM